MPMDMPDLDEYLKHQPLIFAKANVLLQNAPKITRFQYVHHAGLEACLEALVEATWEDGREEKEIRYYRDGTRRWVTPALRFVGDGPHYLLSTFASLESQQHYQDQILAAIDAYLGGNGHVG